jgi:hypothetical protein
MEREVRLRLRSAPLCVGTALRRLLSIAGMQPLVGGIDAPVVGGIHTWLGRAPVPNVIASWCRTSVRAAAQHALHDA